MIVIDFESKTTLQFHTTNIKELRQELRARLKGVSITLPEIVKQLETKMSQKVLASTLGVTPRMLRYIKTGKRLTKEPEKGFKKGKKERITGVRAGIINLARKNQIRMTSGGFTSSSIRSYTLLDFVCEKGDEILRDMHEDFFSHYTNDAKEVMLKDYHQIAQQNVRDSILEMCENGDYCENVLYYSLGNRNPKKEIFCEWCNNPLVSNGNKKLLYSALLKK